LNSVNDKLETFYNLCRQHGLKVTPQRIEIYKTLIASKEHPSAESVYEKIHQTLPNVSFDTVNRTLNTLCDVGAAFIVEGSGDVRRFDGNCKSHQHYKCVKCKKIFDFSHENFDNIKVPEEITGQFKVLRATVYIEGLCKSCQDEKTTVNN
jgi:Fur family peroxide stress response transcriptional regulator